MNADKLVWKRKRSEWYFAAYRDDGVAYIRGWIKRNPKFTHEWMVDIRSACTGVYIQSYHSMRKAAVDALPRLLLAVPEYEEAEA